MTATTFSTSSRRRRGFTLVELLVAMALIVFIMVILTEAFTAGTGVFRLLKSQGDMMEKLRAAGSLLGDDLRQPHFDINQKKLSNLFTSDANTPGAGYFYIAQPGSLIEGVDGSGIVSARMANPPVILQPVLCFTVRRNGIQSSDYFAARIFGPQARAFPDSSLSQTTLVPPAFQAGEVALFNQQGPVDYQMPRTLPNLTGLPPSPPQISESGVLISLWSEVGWFLTPELDSNGNAVTTAPTNGVTMPLFTLRRRTRVVIPNDPAQVTPALNASNLSASLSGPRYAEVSCLPNVLGGQVNTLFFNAPSDLLIPDRQAMTQPLPRVLLPAQSTGQPFSFVPLATGAPSSAAPLTNNVAQGDPSWVGDDIVLSDVISFNVRVLAVSSTTPFISQSNAILTDPVTGTPDFQDINGVYLNLGALQTGVFNTGGSVVAVNGNLVNVNFSQSSPPPCRILALEITMRVWDVRTFKSRQMTIVQDM